MTDNAGVWPTWGESDARSWIAIPSDDDDKYSRGVLGVITGSERYPGAAVLGVEGATRAGVGMIRYLGAVRAQDFVLQRRPEVVTADGRVQAWLVGSGMDKASRTADETALIQRALASGNPAVIDSGALDLVSAAVGPAVITPHFRELSAVLADHGVHADPHEIAADAGGWARRSAQLIGQTVLLKGHTTYVAAPDGTDYIVAEAPSWLATAGSGDVLAGILGALVATHAEAIGRDAGALARLAATAALLHGRAASEASGGAPIAALDVASSLPQVIAILLNQ